MKFIRLFFVFSLAAFAFGTGFLARHFHEELARARISSNKYAAQVSTIGARKIDPPPQEQEYTLLFVGDVMLSRGVDYMTQKYGGGNQEYPFLKIADTLRSADFTFGNLENPISERGKNQGSIYSFRANPRATEGLASVGFDAMSVANNHIWDWGRDALEDTINLLKTYNIKPVGAGMNYEDANSPIVVNVQDVKVVIFGYTNLMPRSLEATASRSGLSSFEPEIIKKRIFEIRNSSFDKSLTDKKAEIIVVSLHWGEEYHSDANAFQKAFARELIDAGADLVIGHHPHVVQEVEQYKQGYIAYSLGNFVFDQGFSDETKNGLMLKVEVLNGKIVKVQKIPIRMNDTFQPEMVQ